MSYLKYSKGPIQLYALPGTEDYVSSIAQWIAKDLLTEAKEKNLNISDYLFLDKDEEQEFNSYKGNKEDLIAKYLTGQFSYFSHRNGAVEISISSTARRKDIYVFHTFTESEITDHNGNKKLLSLADQELLLYNTLDAFLEAKVHEVAVFEMNLGQARSDRPKGRGACNLRTFFRNITANGANHFFIYQIHSSKSLIGLDNTKTTYDNMRGQSLIKKYMLHSYIKSVEYFKNVVQKDWIFSSVDAGGKEFAARFSKSFETPLLVVDKRRNPVTNIIEEITILKPESLSLKDKTVYIVDDMIDSGGSIMDVCRKYKEFGAKEINIAVFYGLFSPPAEERINQLRKEGALNKMIITDLVLPNKDFLKRNPFIEVVDTSYTTSRIIMRTNRGQSLEKYFLPLNAEKYLKTKVEPSLIQKK